MALGGEMVRGLCWDVTIGCRAVRFYKGTGLLGRSGFEL